MHVESPAGRAAARARHALALAHRRPEDTALHRALRENLETFLARADQRGRSIPRFVVRELRAYLECGLLPFGFVRVRCAQCGRLCSAVLSLHVRAIFAALRRRAREGFGVARGRCGTVTFVQRFGDALNRSVHFHTSTPRPAACAARTTSSRGTDDEFV